MTILKAAFVGAMLVAASGAAAHAEEGRRLGQDGPVEVAVDVDSFAGPQTRRTTRTALVPLEAGDSFSYLIVDAAINCEARTITGVSISSYDRLGSLLGLRDLPSENEAVQESDGTAAVASAACDGIELTGRSFASVDAFTAWVKDPAAGQ